MSATVDRETFDRAQRRHRQSARLRAIPAGLAAAAMGIPVGVYLSPVLLALSIIVTDLVNLVIPTADVGGAVWALLDRLIDGDLGTIAAIAMILVIWVIPGIVALVLLYLIVAWRLRRIGGEGLALGIGARPVRSDDPQETQLRDVVDEFAIAADIDRPELLIYDDGPANAFVYGRGPDHATLVVARSLLDELDREETQGVVARLVASAVDGDLGLAVDIGAVYVTFGLVTTSLAAIVSGTARSRWRAAVGPLVGRHGTPAQDAKGIASLLGLPDDDQPTNAAGGCLSLLTMGGFIGIGVAIINLFLSGPLLTIAWRSRGYLADATSVDLTRDPDGLARALEKLDAGGRNVPGTAWLELLLMVSSASGAKTIAGSVPRLSDTGLAISLVPSVWARRRRLGAMGAASVDLSAPSRPSSARRRSRAATVVLAAIIVPLLILVGILATIAAALLVYLIALAAFIVLAVVAGPIHELLRGMAGR